MGSMVSVAEQCGIHPYTEGVLTVARHKRNPIESWNPRRVQSYYAQSQSDSRLVSGRKLLKELDGMNNLNIEVFNWFWSNKLFFPLEWCERKNGKPVFVFFWGTILLTEDGKPCVVCMWREHNSFQRGYRLLDSMFDANSPAAQYTF